MTQEDKQSTEHLLKPRYKVIADFPGIKDYSMWVGQIIDADFHRNNLDNIELLDTYPHLFQKLEWWQERKLEEMPEYIYVNERLITKVRKHHTQRYDEFESQDTKYNYAYGICLPATAQQYNDYINKKP